MISKRWITLWYIVVLLLQKRFLSDFEARSLSSPLTVPHNRSWKQSDAILGEKSLRHWSHFKTWISPLSFYYKEQSTANERMFFVVGKHFPTSKQACYFVHARFKYRVYFCGFGYVILCFRFTILSVQPLLTAPFFGRCVQCTRYQWLCTFFHGTWLFSILLLLS